MDQKHNYDLSSISQKFSVEGNLVDASPYGKGHINDTYVARYQYQRNWRHYIHQRINQDVFEDPPTLMNNVQRVTEHLQNRLRQEGVSEPNRYALRLVKTRDGSNFYQDNDGNYWRTYIFIEDTVTRDTVASPLMAHEVARTFGRFQNLLRDLPPPRLCETIPRFHDTAHRYNQFVKAVERDPCNRALKASDLIQFSQTKESLVHVLPRLQKQGLLPERIAHNDTKLNNVLLDIKTGKGLCVIDLDTVMPGLALHDFGDLVRTATGTHQEDERDLSKVQMRFPLFESLARGYLSETSSFLTQTECNYLAFAGKLTTYEIGLRFLTDHLEGDTYFKVYREGHNLDRCRSQFKLVESIEYNEDNMALLVEEILS